MTFESSNTKIHEKMASENETVADIANEMRIEWAQVYFSEGSRRKDGEYCDNEFVAIEPETVADRIEAAHQREVAELRECLKDAVLYNCAICDSKGKLCEVKGFCSEQRWRKALKDEGGAK